MVFLKACAIRCTCSVCGCLMLGFITSQLAVFWMRGLSVLSAVSICHSYSLGRNGWFCMCSSRISMIMMQLIPAGWIPFINNWLLLRCWSFRAFFVDTLLTSQKDRRSSSDCLFCFSWLLGLLKTASSSCRGQGVSFSAEMLVFDAYFDLNWLLNTCATCFAYAVWIMGLKCCFLFVHPVWQWGK